MLKILELFKKSKIIFPLTWLAGFGLSGLSATYIRQVHESAGSQFVTNIEYSIRGWPYYFGVTTFGGDWSYRPNSFLINGAIWWLVISILLEIYLRIRNNEK